MATRCLPGARLGKVTAAELVTPDFRPTRIQRTTVPSTFSGTGQVVQRGPTAPRCVAEKCTRMIPVFTANVATDDLQSQRDGPAVGHAPFPRRNIPPFGHEMRAGGSRQVLAEPHAEFTALARE